MRVVYVPITEKQWLNQLGGFRGLAYQRGSGLGSLFRNLFRVLLPVAKSAGKAIGKQALRTGADIATDIVSGKTVDVKQHARQATAQLLDKASAKLKGRNNPIKGGQIGKRSPKKKVTTQLGTIRV